MMKITALNEETDEEENSEDENRVTREAEESIAHSEYMRALEYKSQGKIEFATILFKALLETRVLNEGISEDKNNEKLKSIRYNCVKNLAIIHQDQNEDELALEYFIKAMDLDETEVHTMHRLGQLALKKKHLDLADHAFQKCLDRNPNHWPSIDGMLLTLCAMNNIMGAYGWALKYYQKDESYDRAVDVLVEITERWPGMVDFFKIVWKHEFTIPEGKTSEGKDSAFPLNLYDIPEDDLKVVKPNLEEFQVESLTWQSVGEFIVRVYKHLEDTKQCILFPLYIDDILRTTSESIEETIVPEEKEKEVSDVEEVLNPPQDDDLVMIQEDGTEVPITEPMESNDSTEDNAPTKPKSRRRCSDLSNLEQWGWHKNKRYSTRKKSNQEKEVDTTVNGYLRKIFAPFFTETFDNQSPFLLEKRIDEIDTENNSDDDENKADKTLKDFETEKKADFERFLKEAKESHLDLILIIYLWIKYISNYWNQELPEDIRKIYYEIYGFYLNHYDLVNWNQLSNEDFNTSYSTTLFFLEMDIERENATFQEHCREINAQWKMLFYHLKFNSGNSFVVCEQYDVNMLRLFHLEYAWAKFENRLNTSVELLQHLEYLFSQQTEGYLFSLPNFKEFKCSTLENVTNLRVELQRKIGLKNVKTLYENNKFEDLIEILKDSLIYSTTIKNSDDNVMKLQTQFEVLLESFWNVEKYEECLVWSERCLKYSLDNILGLFADTFRYKEWSECINFILVYIEELILKDGFDILKSLGLYEFRLVQTLCSLLVHQLDSPFDKNNNKENHPINTKRPWIILHQVLQKNETVITQTESDDPEESLPHTFSLLFTAHDFLGRRQWCTRDGGHLLLYTLDFIVPKYHAPFMDFYRDVLYEYVEQITYCLFKYPAKRARARHIEEHEAKEIEFTWKRAIQIFDLYRPENLPEFDSYKLESISADMEQLLSKMLQLVPKEIDPYKNLDKVFSFIVGSTDELPEITTTLPHQISTIYYLLADYYFKNRDFSKTLKYYMMDIVCNPTRFDSWAGISLSKATKIEGKLNSFNGIELTNFLDETENTLRCFNQCVKIKSDKPLIWIEYGSFAYAIHSFCSREVKHSSDTMSMEQFAFTEARKEKYLDLAFNCFTKADKCYKSGIKDDNDDGHDDKWLNQYMLGKIAEKRKENPKIYLNHYLRASNYLYENNATYPIKINHSNPTNLSIEALEVFYRINAGIIKYLEQHDNIPRELGTYFTQVLKTLASSPFAFNKAKIDDSSLNAYKRKIADKADMANKRAKTDPVPGDLPPNQQETSEPTNVESTPESESVGKSTTDPSTDPSSTEEVKSVESRSTTPLSTSEAEKAKKGSRRTSQESNVTSTTTATGTTTSGSSSGSESSSSDSDSSGSDSESTEENDKRDENSPMTDQELEHLYKICVRNLEECMTRFPEHFKSIYRLVNYYLHSFDKEKDLEKCRQLLLGTYKTNLNAEIQGLFADRKNNNFFNGIWRIPPTEIDRPGSFSSHMVKCLGILIEVLYKMDNYKVLLDISLQLQKTPDTDKRYIKDAERLEIHKQSLSLTTQIMKDIFKKNSEKRNNSELLHLMIDIYKGFKKVLKQTNQKETAFTALLVEVYKFYIAEKVGKLPENCNFLDHAIKMCLQEIQHRKNLEKQGITDLHHSQIPPATSDFGGILKNLPSAAATAVTLPPVPQQLVTPAPVVKPQVPATTASSVSSSQPPPVKKSRSSAGKSTAPATPNLASLMDPSAIMMALCSNPGLLQTQYQTLATEYFKLMTAAGMKNVFATSAVSTSSAKSVTTTASSTFTTSTSASASAAKMPQFDIKSLIESAVAKPPTSASPLQSTTINIGGGELTITPTLSKPSTPKETPPAKTVTKPSTSSSPQSVSVTKVSGNSPSISVKPLSELSAKPAAMPQLPELPKSLSITPTSSAVPAAKPQSKPHISVVPELGKIQKPNPPSSKSSKSKSKPNYSNPYMRTPQATGASPYSFLKAGFNLDNYASQAAALTAYADYIQSSGVNPAALELAKLQLQQMMAQPPVLKKPPTKKQPPKPKYQPPPAPPNIPMIPSRAAPFIPPFGLLGQNLPTSSLASMMPALSQAMAGTVASTATSSTANMAVAHQVSPTKTLQQKLAEKQKANQYFERPGSAGSSGSGGSGQRKNSDVIILD